MQLKLNLSSLDRTVQMRLYIYTYTQRVAEKFSVSVGEGNGMTGPSRPQFVLFGSSIVQLSYSNGGWAATLADIYARKVESVFNLLFEFFVCLVNPSFCGLIFFVCFVFKLLFDSKIAGFCFQFVFRIYCRQIYCCEVIMAGIQDVLSKSFIKFFQRYAVCDMHFKFQSYIFILHLHLWFLNCGVIDLLIYGSRIHI